MRLPKWLGACFGVFILMLAFASCGSSAITAGASATPEPVQTSPIRSKPIGINLNGPADWNSELPFVDVFRLSRDWISQKEGSAWGSGPALELDKNGWVKRLGPDQFAESTMNTIKGGRYPVGTYTVLYEGEGKLAFSGDAKVSKETPGRILIEVSGKGEGFFLQIRQTNPANYIKNIRVIMPGFEATYKKQPFHPNFLTRWRGVDTLRFMDWQLTNDSKVSKWGSYTSLDSANYTSKGVPIEVMADLANLQKANPWFCMPHLADDNFVRQFATVVKAKLDPKLKVYVEYSNEVWNSQFKQQQYAGEMGAKQNMADAQWSNAWHYTAYRSVQIFKIWEEVFGGKSRLVRVLPTQAGNPYVAEQICKFQDAYKHADVLAIAPYFGSAIGPESKPPMSEVENWNVNQLLDHAEKVALPEAIGFIEGNAKVAKQYNLKLVCYEAGQHYVGFQGGENSEKMMGLMHEANKHPRMGEIYKKYLDVWAKNSDGVTCLFASTGTWSKWGSWGLNQYWDDKPSDYPKLKAVYDWAAAKGQKIGTK